MRDKVVAAIPEAQAACAKVGDEAVVRWEFETLRRLLDENVAKDLMPRNFALRTAGGRIAQWLHLHRGIGRLQQLKATTSDSISTFIQFATLALHLAEDCVDWFREDDPLDRIRWEEVDGREIGATFATPPERSSLALAIGHGSTYRFHDTLFARAAAEARARNEAGFALPKLERIEKALTALTGLLNDYSGGSLFSSPVGQELSTAICDAHLLIIIPKRPPRPRTAEEAIEVNGRDWATHEELSDLTGLSTSAIRGRIRQACKSISSDAPFIESLNRREIDLPGSRQPRLEFRIRGVWHLLSVNV